MSDQTRMESPFAVLRREVVRFQLVFGVGFVAAIGGALLFSSLVPALSGALDDTGTLGRLVAYGLLARSWAWLVMPLFLLGAVRLFPLLRGARRPWLLALGAGLGGELVFLVLDLLAGGFATIVRAPAILAVRVVTLALGVELGRRAVLRGQRPRSTEANAS